MDKELERSVGDVNDVFYGWLTRDKSLEEAKIDLYKIFEREIEGEKKDNLNFKEIYKYNQGLTKAKQVMERLLGVEG